VPFAHLGVFLQTSDGSNCQVCGGRSRTELYRVHVNRPPSYSLPELRGDPSMLVFETAAAFSLTCHSVPPTPDGVEIRDARLRTPDHASGGFRGIAVMPWERHVRAERTRRGISDSGGRNNARADQVREGVPVIHESDPTPTAVSSLRNATLSTSDRSPNLCIRPTAGSERPSATSKRGHG
jgi:hypothetical protein